MKRIVAAAILLTLIGCHRGPALGPKSFKGPQIKMAASAAASSVDLFDTSLPEAPTGITRIARVGGALMQSTDGAAYAAIGGGSSSGFGSNLLLNLPNSLPSNVLAWQSVISLCTNTAGNETACWKITHPLNGIDYMTDLDAINAAGRQTATTTTATPTVTMNPYVDLLEIDVTTTTATTLTVVLGSGLQAAGRIEIWGNVVGPAAPVLIKMNGTDNTGQVQGFFFNSNGATTQIAQGNCIFADNTASNVYATATLRATAAGSPKIYQAEQIREPNEYENYAGRTAVTADITSFSMNGVPPGSTIYVQLGRAVNN
jgi:hypothetical protein